VLNGNKKSTGPLSGFFLKFSSRAKKLQLSLFATPGWS